MCSASSDDENQRLKRFMESYGVLAEPGTMPPMCKINGCWAFAFLGAFWDEIYNMPINEDDVLLTGFAKSGTNWALYIIELILQAKLAKHGVAWTPFRPQGILENPFTFCDPLGLKKLAASPSPRIFSTNLHAHLLPKHAMKAKMICMRREPKDVTVSFYHHYIGRYSHTMGFKDTFDAFVERMIAGKVLFGPYPEHVNGFLALKDKFPEQILVVHYEDLIADHRKGVRTIAEFLGFPEIDNATVDDIAAKTSFQAMKKNDLVNWSEKKKLGIWRADIDFIRKGEVGGWKNHFTSDEQVARFDEAITRKLRE